VQLAGEHCALEYVALDTLEYVFRIIFYVVFLHTFKSFKFDFYFLSFIFNIILNIFKFVGYNIDKTWWGDL